MSGTVGSMAQLVAEIKSRCQQAVQITRDEVYEVIQSHIDAYYSDYSPKVYIRTRAFANSLVKIDVSISGTSISTEVKIDEGYLGSAYSAGDSPTGMQVVEAANSAVHGAIGFDWVEGNVQFWDDALAELGGEAGIEAKLISNLKACGL